MVKRKPENDIVTLGFLLPEYFVVDAWQGMMCL